MQKKMRAALGRTGQVLFWICVAWVAVASFITWLFNIPDPFNSRKPREGDQCGPGHRWAYVRTNVTDPDLSCEPEK